MSLTDYRPSIAQAMTLVFVLLICFIATSSQAQTDFRQGYIIKVSGDTVHGFVAYRMNAKNSQSCLFKTSSKGEVTKYSPNDLSGYGIVGYKYYQVVDLPKDLATSGKIFSTIVSSGSIDLYKYKRRFFIHTSDSTISLPEPVALPYNEKNGETKQIKKDYRYIGILNLYLSDCGLVANTSSYTEKDLGEIVSQYNLCKDKNAIQPGRAPLIKFNGYIFAGFLTSKLTYENYHHTYILGNKTYKINFDGGSTVVPGIGFEISAPRAFDRLFFLVEAIYIKNYYQGAYEFFLDYDIARYDVMLDVESVQIPIGVKYNLLSKTNTPYIKAGGSWFYAKNALVREFEEVEAVSTSIIYSDQSGDNYELKAPKSVWFAAGYTRKIPGSGELFVEARYDIAKGYLGSRLVDYSDLKSFSLLAGFRF
jgi:hypothetical protein